uniref:Uncharacterized protein n=1 Tax=Vombatus ursinus TaxID=29139 RepID=A0A4X2L9H4_VOMUR
MPQNPGWPQSHDRHLEQPSGSGLSVIRDFVVRIMRKTNLFYKTPQQLQIHELNMQFLQTENVSKFSGDSPALTASFSRTTLLKMKRMYLEGTGVRGPSFPSKWRILVASTVCSQSSMNSQR